MEKIPSGLKEIREMYGVPPASAESGSPDEKAWRKSILKKFTLPTNYLPVIRAGKQTREIWAHHLVGDELIEILCEILRWDTPAKPLPISGPYAWRPARGLKKLSTHCWGISIDIDPQNYPLGSNERPSFIVVDAFERRGWFWGGRWRRPDPMHFQRATGY